MVALIIMDGFGIRRSKYGNAIKAAKTPNIDYLLKKLSSHNAQRVRRCGWLATWSGRQQ